MINMTLILADLKLLFWVFVKMIFIWGSCALAGIGIATVIFIVYRICKKHKIL